MKEPIVDHRKRERKHEINTQVHEYLFDGFIPSRKVKIDQRDYNGNYYRGIEDFVKAF